MGKLCKWEIRIPNGTFLEIEPFEYTLDCLPWVEGESSYNDDRILTTGFAGGTTVVTSEQTKGRKCQGNWERTTSIQRNLEISFRSNNVRERKDKNANFIIPLSTLQRKKR